MGSNIVARISGRAHRFSDILFGLGSDPIIGLGNIAYPVNQNWLPSIVLSQDQSGAVDGPLAFVIAATELFAATVLCGRLDGFAIGPSIAAGWLITMTTWQLFGLADDRHHMVLLSRPCRGARCFDCHGEQDISSRQGTPLALNPARGRHFFRSDTHSARGSDVVGSDSADFGNDYCRKAAVIEQAAGIADDHPLLGWHWLGGVGARLRALSRGSAYLFGCGPISGSVKTAPHPFIPAR